MSRLCSLYTLTSHRGRCMSHVISMHRVGDPRQTAVKDLSRFIPCLAAPRFEHSSLVVRSEKLTHSAIGTMKRRLTHPSSRCHLYDFSNVHAMLKSAFSFFHSRLLLTMFISLIFHKDCIKSSLF
jgi:hypothetical protein